jgi:hypothetical protein
VDLDMIVASKPPSDFSSNMGGCDAKQLACADRLLPNLSIAIGTAYGRPVRRSLSEA